MTYKVQELLYVGTRHKRFHFLTQGVAVGQGTWWTPCHLLPKDVHPRMAVDAWQQATHNNFLAVRIQAHSHIPSLAVSPQLGERQGLGLLRSFPLELCTGRLQIWYKLVMKSMVVCDSRHDPVVK